MKKKLNKTIALVFCVGLLINCKLKIDNRKIAKPKLVVTIVIDQMRHEYLNRFSEKFSEGGFKKLRNEGFSYENAHHNYMPTGTGPGHALFLRIRFHLFLVL